MVTIRKYTLTQSLLVLATSELELGSCMLELVESDINIYIHITSL